jgi:alpha-D-xyloside xylohydrolase
LGEPIESTNQVQAIAKVRVYPGADGDFTLYPDDGKTYAYEKGDSSITHLHWDDASQKLSHEGVPAWKSSDAQILEIAGHLNSTGTLVRVANLSGNSALDQHDGLSGQV